jgi:uncharacterized protein YbjT (DUF2867 family)
MILVTGVTGTVGRELCRLLLEANLPFRAMCRSDEQVQKLAERGVQAVRGSFDDAESLERAMHGCDRLFLLVPSVPEQATFLRRALDAAAAIGIQHITRVSAADANLDTKVPWARAHAVADHDLRSRAVRWTILKPTGFMQNMLWSAKPIAHGLFPHLTGDGRVGYIDARDVAAVASRVLTENEHDGATYFLTGPEALSAAEIASRISTALERPVASVQLAEDVPVRWTA